MRPRLIWRGKDMKPSFARSASHYLRARTTKIAEYWKILRYTMKYLLLLRLRLTQLLAGWNSHLGAWVDWHVPASTSALSMWKGHKEDRKCQGRQQELLPAVFDVIVSGLSGGEVSHQSIDGQLESHCNKDWRCQSRYRWHLLPFKSLSTATKFIDTIMTKLLPRLTPKIVRQFAIQAKCYMVVYKAIFDGWDEEDLNKQGLSFAFSLKTQSKCTNATEALLIPPLGSSIKPDRKCQPFHNEK